VKYHHKHSGVFFSLVIAFMLIGISSQNTTALADSGTAIAAYKECSIDLTSAAASCLLSKGADDRIVWVNKSRGDLYVCTDPKKSPFEAYGWYVPSQDQRKSGSIWTGVNPPPGKTVTFTLYTSSKPCGCPKPKRPRVRTNPKIIIGN
jgi:hypothetical protein